MDRISIEEKLIIHMIKSFNKIKTVVNKDESILYINYALKNYLS